jgi:hypothetical protein
MLGLHIIAICGYIQMLQKAKTVKKSDGIHFELRHDEKGAEAVRKCSPPNWGLHYNLKLVPLTDNFP